MATMYSTTRPLMLCPLWGQCARAAQAPVNLGSCGATTNSTAQDTWGANARATLKIQSPPPPTPANRNCNCNAVLSRGGVTSLWGGTALQLQLQLLRCISRESSPGHIDGNDVFYH